MARKRTTRIVIHCADTDPSWHGPVSIATIRRWHVEERGWKDVGYHYYIRHSGAVEIGRPEGAVGAHAAGYNADSIAICLEGGSDITVVDGRRRSTPTARHFTNNQWKSLESLVVALMSRHPEVTDVCGHRDLPGVGKACPSFDVREWWAGAQQSHDMSYALMFTGHREMPIGTLVDPDTLLPVM
jgi:N-acetylmuramoyl-L-alanine amidase